MAAPLLTRVSRLAHEYVAAAKGFTSPARRYLLAAALQNVGYGILGTVFAIYLKERGFSEAVVGDVEGALALSAALVCVLVAPMVGRWGYRALMLVAAVALALGRGGQAFAGTATGIVLLGLVFGVGDGLMQTLSVAFLAENSHARERTHLFTADFVVRVFAAFVGALLGGFVPGLISGAGDPLVGLRATLFVGALLMLSSALPVSGIRETVHRAGHPWRDYVDSIRGFTSWSRLGRLLAPQGVTALGAGLVMPFVALFLKHHVGATLEQVGFVQAVSSIAMALAAFATPVLARRFGLAGTVVLTEVLSLPFLLAIPLASGVPVVATLMWIRGTLMNMSWPVYNQISMEGVPARDKPLVSGGLRFGWSVAWLVGSTVGGRLTEISYTTPYFMTAALYAVAAAMTWVLLRGIKVASAEETDLAPIEPIEPVVESRP